MSDENILEMFLRELRPSCAGKMFGNLLEVDIVVNFLVCVGRWCEIQKNSNENNDKTDDNSNNDSNMVSSEKNVPSVYEKSCRRMFSWYEEISKISSFRTLRLFLTQDQKNMLNKTLEIGQNSVDRTSPAGILALNRIKEIQSLWLI